MGCTWQAFYDYASSESDYSVSGSTASSNLPVELLPLFDNSDNMVGTSKGFEATESDLELFATVVIDIEAEHSKLMQVMTVQEKRKLAKKFASLLQVNGIAMKCFTKFERGDNKVRQQMNLILSKAGLNVQTVMEQYWEELAAVTNCRGEVLRDLMDHNRRLKNYFEVKFQEYAGALS